MGSEDKPTCFIAMPIATRDHEVERYDGDDEHWIHVMETIHVPAVEAAGFRAIRPVASGSHMIHGEIIKHLSFSDIVLCDLSSHNPNVFFELGVRTSLNKPVALVRDEHTSLPFDTSGLNTHQYSSTLRGWDIGDQIKSMAKHLRESDQSCRGGNPLWRHFGLTISADRPDAEVSSSDAQMQLMYEAITDIRGELARSQKRAAEFVSPSEGIRSIVRELAEMLELVLPLKLEGISTGSGGSHVLHYTKSPLLDDERNPEWQKRIFHEAKALGFKATEIVTVGRSLDVSVVPY